MFVCMYVCLGITDKPLDKNKQKLQGLHLTHPGGGGGGGGGRGLFQDQTFFVVPPPPD